MDARKMKSSGTGPAAHTWLILFRAAQAIETQLEADLERCGLSSTDFRILEALLHKGPLPVNAIGPKVHLTPGSVSVAVDRLLDRGLVSRGENARDRRIRDVAISKAGEKVISPVFRRHSALLDRIMAPLTADRRSALEDMLKTIGKRAEKLNDPLFEE